VLQEFDASDVSPWAKGFVPFDILRIAAFSPHHHPTSAVSREPLRHTRLTPLYMRSLIAHMWDIAANAATFAGCNTR
jgi:hypothetical protein